MKPFVQLDIQLKKGNFSLQIEEQIPSGITGVFGSSGHGKTSLLKTISGIFTPDRGSININGHVVFSSKDKINIPIKDRKIGYVFQEDRLFPHLTILKNLKYAISKNDKIELEKVVHILKIGRILNKHPEECSGGEKQRAAIARVLLSSPRLILLDEPFSAVDNRLRKNIIPYLIEINKVFNIPMVVVSHDLTDLLSLTNHITLLNNGRVQRSGKFHDLISIERNITLMQGTGLCNAFSLSVSNIDQQKKIVFLKNTSHDFTLQAILQSFKKEIKVGDEVKVLIRPEDISLSHSSIRGISLRNQLKGVIIKVFLKDGYSFCLVDVGEKLLVEITEASKRSMDLKEGNEVYCLFKSVALKII